MGSFYGKGHPETRISSKICTKNVPQMAQRLGFKLFRKLQHCKLTELSTLRKYLRLCYFYNLVNDRFEFPENPATLRQPTYNSRSSQTSTYTRPHAVSNAFSHSFFPKTISDSGTLYLAMLNLAYPYHRLKAVYYYVLCYTLINYSTIVIVVISNCYIT